MKILHPNIIDQLLFCLMNILNRSAITSTKLLGIVIAQDMVLRLIKKPRTVYQIQKCWEITYFYRAVLFLPFFQDSSEIVDKAFGINNI